MLNLKNSSTATTATTAIHTHLAGWHTGDSEGDHVVLLHHYNANLNQYLFISKKIYKNYRFYRFNFLTC